MEYLQRVSRVSLTHVTYKGGSEVVTAVMGGHVVSFISGSPPALAHIGSGRLRVLAVSTLRRVDVLPDVPPVAESGLRCSGRNKIAEPVRDIEFGQA